MEYTNKFIEYNNKVNTGSSNEISRFVDELDRLNTNIEKNENGDNYNFQCWLNLSTLADNQKTLTTLPDGLDENEKKQLQENTNAYFTHLTALKGACDDLAAYITSKSYKDDKFEKGKTLIAKTDTELSAFYTVSDTTASLIQTIAEKYDPTKNSQKPGDVALRNMKAVLTAGEGILKVIEQEKTTPEEIEAKLTAFQKVVAEKKAATPEGLKTMKTVSDMFYDSAEKKMISQTQGLIRDFREKGSISDQSYNTMLGNYNGLVDSYNSFSDTIASMNL